MAYTLQTLYTEVQNEVDDQDSKALTVIKQALNDGGERIWQAAQFSFKEQAPLYLSSVDGTQSYSLASLSFGRILQIGYKGNGDADYTKLKEISYDEFLQRNTDPTVTSRPFAYALYNNTLYLLQTPDYSGSNNIRIVSDKPFTRLELDADVPLIPQKYQEVLKAYAKAAYWDFDDDTRANGEWARFESLLRNMKADELDATSGVKVGRLFR